MALVVVFLSIWIFIKTLCYGIYEIKNNSNKPGGITIILISIISLIFPNIMIYIRGAY